MKYLFVLYIMKVKIGLEIELKLAINILHLQSKMQFL